MTAPPPTPAVTLARSWRRLRPIPGGRWIFGLLLGWMVPYTRTIHPAILELEPGYARVGLADRRRVRNHLRSIHAVALANLGELATGLATTMALPPGVRAILTSLSTEYVKKARGPLVAECRCSVPGRIEAPLDHRVEAEIKDGSGDVVARTTANWRLGPA